MKGNFLWNISCNRHIWQKLFHNHFLLQTRITPVKNYWMIYAWIGISTWNQITASEHLGWAPSVVPVPPPPLCVYIYIYIYTHTHIYIYIYIFLYIYIYIYIYIYCLTTPLKLDVTSSIFKLGLKVGILSFLSSRLVAIPRLSLPFNLPIDGRRLVCFIPFPRVLGLCEM